MAQAQKRWRIILAIGALGIVLSPLVFWLLLRSLPALDRLAFNPAYRTTIVDRNGEVITRLFTENRIHVSLEEIPLHMQQAIVAVEDHRFYSHPGADLAGIARAIYVDLRQGGYAQGGSTITQQLVKNSFLTHDKTMERKIRELIYSFLVEIKYTKDEILEAYLNQIYFGHGTYGVGAAAELYFGKHVSELTLDEAALLAGLPRGPGYYSPFLNQDSALARRRTVLGRMETVGYISSDELRQAHAAPLVLAERKRGPRQASYFVDYLLVQLEGLGFAGRDLYTAGLTIQTTLDLGLQRQAENALWSGMPKGFTDGQGLIQPQGALLTLDPHTGAVLAMVGGRGTDHFNRATRALRQPGSAIKPFIYLAALEAGHSAADLIEDTPVSYPLPGGGVWSPENYDGRALGPISLGYSVELSRNLTAIRLLEELGPVKVIDRARDLGITTLVSTGEPNDRHLALALGGITRGVSLWEMVGAYGILAAGGVHHPGYVIQTVRGPQGELLYEHRSAPREVVDPRHAYITTALLELAVQEGTGKAAQIGRPVAGKTGTSSQYTNAWFIGYTPEMVTGVWLGNDSQAVPMVYNGQTVGSGVAARIWATYMGQALREKPVQAFPIPAGITPKVPIDIRRGMLATNSTPQADLRFYPFIEGEQPQVHSDRGILDTLVERVGGGLRRLFRR